jgi:acetyl-CoA synthetase
MVMDYAEIAKDVAALRVTPHMRDYEETCANWSWDAVRAELDRPNGLVNQAHECIDRHALGARRDKVAMIWEAASGSIERYTFEDMRRQTNRFANVLRGLGVTKGERVFLFADRIPELYFALFGVLKTGAIAAPLFSAFGPEPVAERVRRAEGVGIITTPRLLPKIEAIRAACPSLEWVMVIDREGGEVAANTLDYSALMAGASDEFAIERTGPEDWSIMHFTSGTTGLPKGAAHVHEAVTGHYATGKYVMDFHEEDIYWCTADPGWVTGTSYGIFAPWSNGATQLIYEGGYGAAKWFELIDRHKVTIWYTAPTAIRMLMKSGTEIPHRSDLSSLRYALSVGEPLNPEGVVWGEEAIGMPFHDSWWQTETGAIMITNYLCLPIKPGSMGKPFPGIVAGILDENFNEITEHNAEGQLAIKHPWPSMFRAYWNDDERYHSRFKGEWYITGDRAHRDEDGYFWFVGRDDDVINTAGHLVGPFEVESVLIEHPAVAEAGVIGKPDPVAMEVVKAFVSLKDGFAPSEELRRELIGHARARLGPGVAPREIDFLPSLPKTRSGKIMRRLLKARELGLPEGDTSTLEED